MEAGGHPAGEVHGGDVLEGLGVQQHQVAAIGGPVVDVAHEHAVVLAVGVRVGNETELARLAAGTQPRSKA